MIINNSKGIPSGTVADLLVCDTLVSEFELQSRYYTYFWINALRKVINTLPCYGLNNTITVFLQGWIWHWITQKVDMPLNKETNQTTT